MDYKQAESRTEQSSLQEERKKGELWMAGSLPDTGVRLTTGERGALWLLLAKERRGNPNKFITAEGGLGAG